MQVLWRTSPGSRSLAPPSSIAAQWSASSRAASRPSSPQMSSSTSSSLIARRRSCRDSSSSSSSSLRSLSPPPARGGSAVAVPDCFPPPVSAALLATRDSGALAGAGSEAASAPLVVGAAGIGLIRRLAAGCGAADSRARLRSSISSERNAGRAAPCVLVRGRERARVHLRVTLVRYHPCSFCPCISRVLLDNRASIHQGAADFASQNLA